MADNDPLILDFVNGRVLDGADLGEYYMSGLDDDPPANWEVFEAIARLDHPDAEGVLTMFGRYTTDKKTAKAARRAAYKASTRRAARR